MNKNKTILIIGIIMVAIVLTITGTYAYWTITKSQSTNNTLIGGCLNIELTDTGAGINLEKAWPISDFEGMQLEGYTFSVTNLCDEPQDYRIDLDRLEESAGAKEMSNEYLATLLDYGSPVVYSDLESHETTEDGVKEKRVIAYDTVMGKSTNEHTLRLWIDEESPVSEQGSTFLSKVKINAGQGIEKYYTKDECFTFDATTGSITAYDEACGGTDVVIPYEITPDGATDAVAVTQIGASAFKEKGITSVEFPRSVTIIGNNAFQSNPTLEKVIFREGLTSIKVLAFAVTLSPIDIEQNRGKLEFVFLPEGLVEIYGAAFSGNSLKQIIIPDSVTNMLATKHFSLNKIKYFKIGKGVTVLPGETFRANFIEKVEIPDHVTKLTSNDFGNNPIKEIKLGAGLTYIGPGVFNNGNLVGEGTYPRQLNYLKEVYIPANVTSIEMHAFYTATSDVIIKTERTKEDFLANVTAETNGAYRWYGAAQVISSDGLNIYE